MVITNFRERKSVGLDEYGDYERPLKKKRKEQEREEDVEMRHSEEPSSGSKPSSGSTEKKKTVEEIEKESKEEWKVVFPSEPQKVKETGRLLKKSCQAWEREWL